MTDLKAEAIKLIEQMPAEEMPRIFLEIQSMYKRYCQYTSAEKALKTQHAQKALEEIHAISEKYRGKIPADFDYKKELEDALWERYEEKHKAALAEYEARQQSGTV